MDPKDFEALRRKFPVSAAVARLNSGDAPVREIPSPEPQRDPEGKDRKKLDGGEAQSSGRARVIIESRRARLCDPDNLFVKAILDAMRYQGLIRDDRLADI